METDSNEQRQVHNEPFRFKCLPLKRVLHLKVLRNGRFHGIKACLLTRFFFHTHK